MPLRADPPPDESARAATLAAITGRRSIRGFLPDPVSRTTIEAILAAASRAPSGTNIQPWRVHVLTGAARQGLTEAIIAHRRHHPEPAGEYSYYPAVWREPYLGRRRKVGWELYGLLGIGKTDRAAMRAQHNRNFDFFGAPVGMMFTLDRDMGQGAFIDLGMFMQNVMIAARAFGYDTCPQAAFMSYHAIIRARLGLPDSAMVVCGMALGRADPAEAANKLTTIREPIDSFVSFIE
jgi:nitroreductase